MPFYSIFIFAYPNSQKSKIQNRLTATLQVQTIRQQIPDKRAYFKASLSVEAALSFSLFLFACISLSSLFGMLRLHRQVQALVDKLCMDASMYAYASADDKENVLQKEENSSVFDSLLPADSIGEAGIVTVCLAQLATLESAEAMKNLYCHCSFMEEDDCISIRVEYTYALPFFGFGGQGIAQRAFAKRRAYIGKDKGGEKEDAQNSRQEEKVYVGKKGTRYHTKPSCHYLHNDLRAVSMHDLAAQRNQNGGKYHACVRCAAPDRAAAVVYIMPSGSSYHRDRACTAIAAYVRQVDKAEVEHWGACSYCGGE